MNNTSPQTDKNEIVKETAKIAWKELLRYFAGGHAIFVAPSLDLIDVASSCRKDDADRLREWMDKGTVHPVNDSQAKAWLDQDATVWAVVVAPWVLVQEVSNKH